MHFVILSLLFLTFCSFLGANLQLFSYIAFFFNTNYSLITSLRVAESGREEVRDAFGRFVIICRAEAGDWFQIVSLRGRNFKKCKFGEILRF